MKTIMILLMLMITIPAVSQVRLGDSIETIMKEFPVNDYKGMKGNTEDGTLWYAITLNYALVYYFFDKDSNCNMSQVTPLTQGYLNFYTERYNKLYTIITMKSWRAYMPSNIANVLLVYPEVTGNPENFSNKPYFLWTYAE